MQPVDVYSCYWEIRLDCFSGRRCEVGVVVSGAVTSSGIDKARAWFFDCWGRKVHQQKMEEYGGKMPAGACLNSAAELYRFLASGWPSSALRAELHCRSERTCACVPRARSDSGRPIRHPRSIAHVFPGRS